MPVLKDFRQSKKIAIPSYPDSEIEIYNSLLAADSDSLQGMQEKPTAKSLLEVLPKFIKDWNFTDEQGKKLEINSENINFMSEDDLVYIIDQIKIFNESLKKK